MPDPKPIRDTAEELYGALVAFPEDWTLEVGDDLFSVAELRALALFAKQALDAI